MSAPSCLAPSCRALLALLCAAALLGPTLGCGAGLASRSRARYVAAHGVLPRPEEIRVAEFLADYPEALPDPGPAAVGLSLEAARAAWASESSEPLVVVQAAVRARDADVRPPVTLMFVVDRSGSMGEHDKMTYVREALHRLVERLDPRDRVAVTAFDDRAELVLPPTPVADAGRIHRAVDRLYPRGATNLSEGLRVGYEALEAGATFGTLRRVVLLTDAIANVGETDLSAIARRAERHDREGTRLSAIGVGLDHEDGVLAEMARRGRGNHYFLDSPREIERVFAREVQGLLEDVADRVRVRFEPAPGVSVVQVVGADEREGRSLPLGRLGAGQHRVTLWTLRGVDPRDPAPYVGRFEVDYVDLRNGAAGRASAAQPIPLVYSPAEGTVARNAAVAWMARDLREVCALAERGAYGEAWRRLEDLRAMVGAVLAARPGDEELGRDAAMLEDIARALARYGSPYGPAYPPSAAPSARVDVRGRALR